MSTKRRSLKCLRISAYFRQNGRCFYCRKPMWISDIETFAANFSISLKQARYLQCTGEHLVAHSEGGKASPSNIVAACRFCNVKRHARNTPPEPKEFANFVQSRLEKGAWNTHLLN